MNDIPFLEKTYTSFLEDNRSEIRRISIYALLFGLKIKKDKYRDFALRNLEDLENDLDMRLTSTSSIAQAYMGTKEVKILSTLSNIFENTDEDEDLRVECFTAMLKILGLSSTKIIEKNERALISFDDLNIEAFYKEMDEVKKMTT